jgi:DNA repair protein RadC
MKVKDLNIENRPYEKLFSKGAETLTNEELLAIILNNGTKQKSVLDISNEIMTKDKQNIGFSFLTQYSIEELMTINGIGKVKAIKIKAMCEFAKRFNIGKVNQNERISTPEQLSKVFMNDLIDKPQEIVETAVLDSKNRVVKVITNSIGSYNSNQVLIKDILGEPLKMALPKIAISHNHPSGDVSPSNEDILFTQKLNEACNLFGIQLLDHIIIRK